MRAEQFFKSYEGQPVGKKRVFHKLADFWSRSLDLEMATASKHVKKPAPKIKGDNMPMWLDIDFTGPLPRFQNNELFRPI